MGRTIRKVPANWEHPKKEDGTYQPIYDENYEEALQEWLDNHNLWLKGEHPIQKEGSDVSEYKYYAQYDGNPPNVKYYRFYKDEECTHFQMYENVSEGTPKSPVFESLALLEDHLVNEQGYSRHAAHAFCESGYAPTFVMSSEHGFKDGISAYDDLPRKKE